MSEQDWRRHLPAEYDWLDKVSIEAKGTAAGANSLHVIEVKVDDDGQKYTLASQGVPTDLLQTLKGSLDRVNWKSFSGAVRIIRENCQAVVVPLSQLKIDAARKGRQLGFDAARNATDFKCEELILYSSETANPLDVLDGWITGSYNRGLFKGKKPATVSPGLKNIILNGYRGTPEEIEDRRAYLRASMVSRLLQDAPPNWLTPERFAEVAQDLSQDYGIKCEVGGRTTLAEKKMGAFLSVANGSPKDPKLITMEISGKDPKRTVALVGKGLTFDAGGVSIKPAAGMDEMKYDMSGGAAVLGAALYLAKVQPRTRVICVIGAVENMVSGTATRPGDIVTSMNGKTVEVLNTDAEGRLVLCDLLHYAISTYKPEFVIDVATLTGAVLFALGHVGAGMMTNDQGFGDYLMGVSREGGEPFWQLPLWPELEKEVKSEFADLANIAKPNVKAGSIMGGMFLKEFVGDTKWAHLDIAGTAWGCGAQGFPPVGGTGFGIRTMARACLRWE